jgi:hypothetical protein
MISTFSKIAVVAAGLVFLAPIHASTEKLAPEDRIEIIRGLTAEYATVKVFLPRSKKPLAYPSDGNYDKAAWNEAGREMGPAARVGDLIQITKVEIEKDEIKLEINGGVKSGRKWYERIEVGTGNRTSPIGQGGMPTAGTNLSIVFPKQVPSLDVKDLKRILSPILDFEKRTATENYVDSLPEPIQAAIRDKRAVVGMTREQVLIALDRPRHKLRETKDGDEFEDWIYGLPPGKITFVTFQGDKVVKVKEAYAGLGGSTADPLPPR